MLRTSYGVIGATMVMSVSFITKVHSQQPPASQPKAAPVEMLSEPYGAAITHEQVMQLVEGAHAEAKKRNKLDDATIVVTDPDGEIVYAEKAAAARNSHIEIAWAKARASARYATPTKSFYDELQAGNLAQSLALPETASMGIGGIPIVWHGQIIGGLGVAGARAVNDEAIAYAGVAAIR
jgi:glc operon protein GlcG